MEIMKVTNEEEKVYPKFNELKNKKKYKGLNKLKNILVYITSILILLENKVYAVTREDALKADQFVEKGGESSSENALMLFINAGFKMTDLFLLTMSIAFGIYILMKKFVFKTKEVSKNTYTCFKVFLMLFISNTINMLLWIKYIRIPLDNGISSSDLINANSFIIIMIIVTCLIFTIGNLVLRMFNKEKKVRVIDLLLVLIAIACFGFMLISNEII